MSPEDPVVTPEESVVRDGAKPEIACPKCNATAWRRTKRGRAWFCEGCRTAKIAAASKATAERVRSARDAALEARRAAVPAWQRPIYRGDAQDDLIWRFFTLERTRMGMLARGESWSLTSQGNDMVQRAGILRRITDRDRLFAVFCTYGGMVARGEDLGDEEHPPWWQPGKSPFTRR